MVSPVIKGSSYILVHTPHTLMQHGSTQAMERDKNPDSDYLSELPNFLRDYKAAVDYGPNQAYIGNLAVDELGAADQPWY
ncbi:MAG: glycine/sarcosine/betaine reductase complex component C subunit beta, partial [Bacillota bacterium]